MSNQCQKCGKEIEENVLLCAECNVPEPNFGEPVIEKKKKGEDADIGEPPRELDYRMYARRDEWKK